MPSAVSDFISRIFDIFKWWIVIAPWELAIRVRHGKNIKVLGPGPHLRIPGWDRFFIQGIRKRYMNMPTQSVTTSDGKAITVSGGTSYSIEDIAKLYNTLGDAQDVIEIETMSLVANYITTHTLEECNLDRVQDYVGQNLHLEKYGLTGIAFRITDFVCVKTYRIINVGPKDYGNYQSLNTMAERIW